MFKFMIIDDFYPNPDEIREQALNLDYFDVKESLRYPNKDAPWPGRISKTPILPKGIEKQLSKYLQINVRIVTDKSGSSGHFRYSSANDEISPHAAACHVDCIPEVDQQYGAIIYLNKDEQCLDENGQAKKGTQFLRHKASNKTKISTNKEMLYYMGDFCKFDKWIPDITVYLKYNRCVLFDASLFHTYGDFFGDNVRNSRIAQIYNMRPIL